MLARKISAREVLTMLSIIFSYHKSQAAGWETKTNYLQSCAGSRIKTSVTTCPTNSIIKLKSITIFASTDSAATTLTNNNCVQLSLCKRIIHNENDPGLSPSYKHLYRWIQSKCVGRNTCEEGTLPQWWELIGEIKDNAGEADSERICPQTGTKYFTALLVHIECFAGEEISTIQPPEETSPITKPTTPTTTTAFPVFIPIALPGLEDREKIILGLAIGLAIAILIVLLIVLYCCERYRHHKRFGKLLKMLGAPQEQHHDDDDYSKTETWTDDNINPDALGEYTGVKPDEFLSMTTQNMVNTGQIMYDTGLGMTTGGRRNSCSTLSRDSATKRFPSVDEGVYGEPMDYNTEENLELERRMAAVLAGDALTEDLTDDGACNTDSEVPSNNP